MEDSRSVVLRFILPDYHNLDIFYHFLELLDQFD